MEFLDPISVVMYPYEIFPTIHPIAKADPIHDTSSTFIAPVANGLLSDSSNGRAIEIQLIPQPNPINRILACIQNQKKIYSFQLKCISKLYLEVTVFEKENYLISMRNTALLVVCFPFLIFDQKLKN